MVSELVFSDDPSSNPSEDYSFSANIVFEKNKNKEEEAGIGPYLFKKELYLFSFVDFAMYKTWNHNPLRAIEVLL